MKLNNNNSRHANPSWDNPAAVYSINYHESDSLSPQVNKLLFTIKTITCTLLLLFLFSVNTHAALLNVELGLPDILSDTVGQYSYNASTYDFVSHAHSLTVTFDGITIIPISNNGNNQYDLKIKVDNAGNFISGVAGDDLKITGDIDINGDSVYEYSGTLIAGEVTNFGWEGPYTSSKYMIFNLTFTATGGAFLPFYSVYNNGGGDIFAPERTNFVSWSLNHAGNKLKHDTAPIPEPSTILLLGIGLVGYAFMRRKI